MAPFATKKNMFMLLRFFPPFTLTEEGSLLSLLGLSSKGSNILLQLSSKEGKVQCSVTTPYRGPILSGTCFDQDLQVSRAGARLRNGGAFCIGPYANGGKAQ